MANTPAPPVENPFTGLTEEQFKILSEKVYDRTVAEHTRLSGIQLEMAKWMIASLLLVNGAGLIGLAQNTKINLQVMKESGPLFVEGVVAAVCAGLFTWQRASSAKTLLNERISSDFIVDRSRWPARRRSAEISIAMWGVMGTSAGFLSLLFFVLGCYKIIPSLK